MKTREMSIPAIVYSFLTVCINMLLQDMSIWMFKKLRYALFLKGTLEDILLSLQGSVVLKERRKPKPVFTTSICANANSGVYSLAKIPWHYYSSVVKEQLSLE